MISAPRQRRRRSDNARQMKDLTEGSIRRHIVEMALPIMVGMLVQTLYFLVDLYFVSRIGADAIAGVSAAGNVVMIVMALTMVLSVGTVALISHSVGAKNQARANLVFNQSLSLALLCTVLSVLLGLAGAGPYLRTVAAEPAITEAGGRYLLWYLPGLALQFPMAAMGAALRGTGLAKPGMVVQMLTVGVNIVLAPVLIAGWGTGHALGVLGAGLASTLAIVVGVVVMLFYFVRLESYVSFDAGLLRPRADPLLAMLRIGLPAGGEFFLMFIYMAVIYWLIRPFGAPAQAGFGIGMRVMQSVFLPAMAISFAVPAVAGQNFGARSPARVRDTLKQALVLECSMMLLLTLLCQVGAPTMIGAFTAEAQVAAVAVTFLRIISLNFVAMGVVFACSGMFQALGNTWPAMASTATRLLTFTLPAVWLSLQPGFALVQLWTLSVLTVLLQAGASALLVRWQMRHKLTRMAAAA